jgi:sugar lactone lactonase YvrE
MTSKGGKSAVHVFDGQHKAAAQIMLGAKAMPVRVFIDPDPDTLITTNTNAGTTLKQVAFDKSVQRHLGSTLYRDRIERFRTETNRQGGDDLAFSERDLVATSRVSRAR